MRTWRHPIVPVQFRKFWKKRRGTNFRMLDVGCGNHSPLRAKRWFPQLEYFGLDRAVYNNSAGDFDCMAHFYQLDLNHSDLAEIPDGHFDVIVMSHVMEHLENGLEVVRRLAQKLAPGGDIYIEFPSQRSLRLPHGDGTLHFCDDPTHVRLCSVREVANILLAAQVAPVYGGRRRSWPHCCIGIALLPVQLAYWLRHRKWIGFYLWDLLGFADCIYAVRRLSAG